MAGNTFGKLFSVTTFGESHGAAIGCIVDGCPPGMDLSEDDIQPELDRRKPGTSRFVTQRREPDAVKILSGVYQGKTTGYADSASDRKSGPAQQGLQQYRRRFSPRPCRLSLLSQIWLARPERWWPFVSPFDGCDRCRSGDCQKMAEKTLRCRNQSLSFPAGGYADSIPVMEFSRRTIYSLRRRIPAPC